MDKRQLTHEVYSFLLDKLTVTKRLKAHFAERGIKSTYGAKDCENIVISILETVEKFGKDCLTVAGFYKQGEEIVWAYRMTDAFIIPLLDTDGKIWALKIRAYGKSGTRYMYVDTSKRTCGTAMLGFSHFPTPITPNMQVNELRVTEGEIKAQVASEFDKSVITFSMGGISMFKALGETLQPLNLHPRKVRIAFDMDTYRKNSILYQGTNAFSMLLQTYQTMKRLYPQSTLVLERWSEEYGKGIDDVILGGHADKIEQVDAAVLEEEIKKRAGLSNCDGWVYVAQSQSFFRVDNSTMYFDKSQFSDSFLSGKVTTKKIIDERIVPVFHIAEYNPTKPSTYVENGLEVFNLYRGMPKIIRNTTYPQLFVDHINLVTPEYQEIVLDFLAYQVQNVGKKMKWALVIQGTEGIGKSFIGAVMKKLLGENNVGTPSNENMREQFNLWARACALCIVEEFMTFGRQELMNKLKPMITDNQIMIRTMRVDSFPVPNRFNIMGFTNYRNALKLDKYDRRYCVIHSDMKPQGKVYYEKLFAMLNDDVQVGGLLNFLMERDLSKFAPHAHAPMTDAKIQAIEASYTQEEGTVRDFIEDETMPDLVCLHDLENFFITKKTPVPMHKLRQVMIQMGMYSLPNPIRLYNVQKRFWVMRNMAHYKANPAHIMDYVREKYTQDVVNSQNPLFVFATRAIEGDVL